MLESKEANLINASVLENMGSANGHPCLSYQNASCTRHLRWSACDKMRPSRCHVTVFYFWQKSYRSKLIFCSLRLWSLFTVSRCYLCFVYFLVCWVLITKFFRICLEWVCVGALCFHKLVNLIGMRCVRIDIVCKVLTRLSAQTIVTQSDERLLRSRVTSDCYVVEWRAIFA